MNKIFADINTLLKGLFIVFKHLFKRAITLEYPEKNRIIPETFRGKPFISHCCGCKTCIKVCPANAITMRKNDKGKVTTFIFDLKKCIFCVNCEFYCPKKSIKMTKEFDLAQKEKSKLILEYDVNSEGNNVE
jgi:NADH-quinone oxidoreductase subunit I